MTETMIERVARALWDARERRFPERVRRPPDELDHATDAWTYCAQDARTAIAAHEAALAEAGYVIVPRQPTAEMCNAPYAQANAEGRLEDNADIPAICWLADENNAARVWQAMISAALSEPQPQKSPPSQEEKRAGERQ